VHEGRNCEPLKGSKRLLNLVEHFAVLSYSAEAGKESTHEVGATVVLDVGAQTRRCCCHGIVGHSERLPFGWRASVVVVPLCVRQRGWVKTEKLAGLQPASFLRTT
jgi:hypothetical protein